MIEVLWQAGQTPARTQWPEHLVLSPCYTSPYGSGFTASSKPGTVCSVVDAKTHEPVPEGSHPTECGDVVVGELRGGKIVPVQFVMPLGRQSRHWVFEHNLLGPPLRHAQDASFFLRLEADKDCWDEGDAITILVSRLVSSLGG